MRRDTTTPKKSKMRRMMTREAPSLLRRREKEMVGARDLKVGVEVITPDLAKAWLEASDGMNFRNIVSRKLETLMADISACGYSDDGSPFRFHKKGYLIDGQHRLAAISALGITVSAVVIRGVSNDGVYTCDTGTPRLLRDFLKQDGHVNVTQLAATIRLAMSYEAAGEFQSFASSCAFSIRAGVDFLRSNPGLTDSVKLSIVFGSAGTLRTTEAALLHFLASKHGMAKDAELFLESVRTGVGLPKTDPVYALRERMLEDRRSKTRLVTHERIALLTIAWNKWIVGRQVKALRWRSTGPAAQPWPVLSFSRQEPPEAD